MASPSYFASFPESSLRYYSAGVKSLTSVISSVQDKKEKRKKSKIRICGRKKREGGRKKSKKGEKTEEKRRETDKDYIVQMRPSGGRSERLTDG